VYILRENNEQLPEIGDTGQNRPRKVSEGVKVAVVDTVGKNSQEDD
jgi:hypothetical protein